MLVREIDELLSNKVQENQSLEYNYTKRIKRKIIIQIGI